MRTKRFYENKKYFLSLIIDIGPRLGWLKITKFLLRHGSSLPGVRNTVVIIMKKRKVKKI